MQEEPSGNNLLEVPGHEPDSNQPRESVERSEVFVIRDVVRGFIRHASDCVENHVPHQGPFMERDQIGDYFSCVIKI